MSAPDVAQIVRARERAAARYPAHLTDTLGREHPSVVRAAILAGHWDQGEVVRGEMEGRDG